MKSKKQLKAEQFLQENGWEWHEATSETGDRDYWFRNDELIFDILSKKITLDFIL